MLIRLLDEEEMEGDKTTMFICQHVLNCFVFNFVGARISSYVLMELRTICVLPPVK